jgi:hypothetical protein
MDGTLNIVGNDCVIRFERATTRKVGRSPDGCVTPGCIDRASEQGLGEGQGTR